MSTVELQEPRNIVSPRPGKQWGTKAPTRPGDPGFNDALCEVTESVKMTEMGHWPTELIAKNNPTDLSGEIPKLLRRKLRLGTKSRPRPRNMALAVSMDKPWHLGEFLLDELLSMGEKFNIDKPGTIQFCDKDASYLKVMYDINEATTGALDRVFDVKYYWKEPRPEDYLRVHGSIFNVDGNSAPGHWRYGAGHGAAAGATASVINRSLALSPELQAEVVHACWVFAHGRTMLGVHFHEDNELGFGIGRQF